MNIVEQIHDAIKSTTASVLGAGWVEMRRVFDPSQNDTRTAGMAYGVLHGSASGAAGVQRYYTMDHQFAVVLSRSVVERQDDTEHQAVINEMYDVADDLLVEVFLKKLGLPSIVIIVDNPSISEPQILENGTVIMRVGFNVKYRNAVNL